MAVAPTSDTPRSSFVQVSFAADTDTEAAADPVSSALDPAARPSPARTLARVCDEVLYDDPARSRARSSELEFPPCSSHRRVGSDVANGVVMASSRPSSVLALDDTFGRGDTPADPRPCPPQPRRHRTARDLEHVGD